MSALFVSGGSECSDIEAYERIEKIKFAIENFKMVDGYCWTLVGKNSLNRR